jgi:hypothetical protein
MPAGVIDALYRIEYRFVIIEMIKTVKSGRYSTGRIFRAEKKCGLSVRP